MRVLAETPGKVLRHGGVDVLDARSGAVSRPTVITSYSYCSHLHQMSIHLSCTETILVICFRSVIKRQQLWRHPRLMMKWTPAIRIFKKCREFFAVKILDLFIIEYVWEICNMYTLNLCPDSGLSCLVLSSKVLVPMLAQDQGATDFVHLQRNSLHQRKKLTWQFHWTRFKNS